MRKMKGVTADEMADIDRRARDEYGITQADLMENAGRAVFESVLSDVDDISEEKIIVFCGKGNNGGDGFVAARYFAERFPGKLCVYATDAENMRDGAARDNLVKTAGLNIDIGPLKDFLENPEALEGGTICIDAIFGTGFKGHLMGDHAALAARLNSSDVKLYAVDVPSGLDSTTGEVEGGCITASTTVTFGLPKQGFFVKDGPSVCGKIVVKDIGFPRELLAEYIDQN